MFDAVSAYNNVSRERVLQRVAAVAPHLLTWTAVWLTRPSTAVLKKPNGERIQLQVCCGLDQGDPFAPFLFALGLPVHEIQRRLRQLLTTLPAERAEQALAALFGYPGI